MNTVRTGMMAYMGIVESLATTAPAPRSATLSPLMAARDIDVPMVLPLAATHRRNVGYVRHYAGDVVVTKRRTRHLQVSFQIEGA